MKAEVKMLPEDGSLFFSEIPPLLDFFREQKETDVWRDIQTADLGVIALDSIPILAEEVKKDYGMAQISTETVRDCMDGMTKIALSFPLMNDRVTYPMRDCAFDSLLKRAGIQGASISSFADKPYRKALSQQERALILNTLLKKYSNMAKLLLRNERISAVMAGDEKDYTVLPVYDLLNTLIGELEFTFPHFQLLSAETSHTITMVLFDLNQKELITGLEDSVKGWGEKIPAEGIRPMLQLVTSDIGVSAASLVPMIVLGGSQVRVGSKVALVHKNASLGDFVENATLVFRSYADNTKHLMEMGKVKIHHPLVCLRALADDLSLPRRAATEVINELEAQASTAGASKSVTNAFVIYYYLNRIVEKHLETMKRPRPEIRFQLQESVARSLRYDFAEFDRAA